MSGLDGVYGINPRGRKILHELPADAGLAAMPDPMMLIRGNLSPVHLFLGWGASGERKDSTGARTPRLTCPVGHWSPRASGVEGPLGQRPLPEADRKENGRSRSDLAAD
jgi:hypothetical protein